MPPAWERFRHFTQIEHPSLLDLPEAVDRGEDLAFVGEDDGDPVASLFEGPAEPVFLDAVQGTEGFVEDQEVVLPPEEGGEVETFQFASREGEGFVVQAAGKPGRGGDPGDVGTV